MSKLTILSYGGGQDSTAILYMYVNSPQFRAHYVPGRFLVIMADTGDEHQHTLDHVEFTKQYCKKNNIEFIHLTADMGYHTGDWQSLRGLYRAKTAVGSKCFPKICTDRLKLRPIYNCLEDWIGKEYGYRPGRKNAFKSFAQDHGRVRVLVGIARGEESRVKGKQDEPWREKSLGIVYPLIDLRMDRQDCQKYARSLDLPVPYPSNCILCPFMSEIELVWLYKNLPDDFQDWVEIERNKLEKYKHIEKNYGVWKNKTLPEVLTGALEKYGNLTPAELDNYKMNHGCNLSKY